MKARAPVWKPEEDEQFEVAAVGNAVVKIYRRERLKPNGKPRFIFEVADYSTGARRLLSFSKLAKAREKASHIAELLSTGDATAAAMRNSDAASYGRALELLRPTGVSLEVAAAHFAEAYKILGRDKIVSAAEFFKARDAENIVARTVAEVVEELVTAREARDKSRRYVSDLRARLRKFAKTFAVDISTVTTADVQGWLDGLKVAPRTAKNFRGALSTLFKFATARQYIAKGSNPVADTEEISINGDGAIEIYSPDEIAGLLKAASKDFLPVVALGAFGGLRSAEIERLTFGEIDFTSGYVTVAAKKSKTRSRRLVPILPSLAAWLRPYARQRGKVWKGSERDLLDARAATVEKSGIAWKANALRHSFISYRLAGIQNAAQVALEAGNSPAMVFKHYRELVKPEAATGWFSIAPETPANVIAMSKSATA